MDNILQELRESVEKELEKITKKNDITPAELENATKAVCLIEKIKMLEELDSYDGDAYSENSYRSPRMRMSYGEEGMYADNSYRSPHVRMSYGDDDMSYRRGRSMTTGRYMSRDDGYSGHSIKDRMISKLENMMDEAKTEHERQTVNDWIRRLSNE